MTYALHVIRVLLAPGSPHPNYHLPCTGHLDGFPPRLVDAIVRKVG